MEFNIKKPAHWFALLMVLASFMMFILLPIISYFGVLDTSSTTTQFENLPESFSLFFEIFALILQGIFVVILLILSPYVWYAVVNKFDWKQIRERIYLRTDRLDMAFLWGIITAIAAFVIVIIVGSMLTIFGVDVENSSNIQDLEMFFSIPAILFLITLQPIAEEFFFRGFLLDKIGSQWGIWAGIIGSSLFFGVAHLSYANVYPAIMTAIIGVLLAYLVVKTKNLMAAIIAHVLFNLASFTFYLIGQELLTEALML